MSREAIRQFVDRAFDDPSVCKFHEWEDLGISRCLHNLGIHAKDTRTPELKQRFMPFLPDEHFYGTIPSQWLFDDLQYSVSLNYL